jgi:hypothetical protein
MIVHKTFADTHLVNTGTRGLIKRDELRQQAMAFIANQLSDEDVISIAEVADEYASSVTVWYRKL